VDGGVKWTSKTRGIPSYYSTADEETVYPPFYKIVWDSQVADYAANTDFYACSQAGLFYWSKSKFINLGGGLPKTSGDWNHFSVFDFANTADAAYIGTELGVYKATVDIAKAQANWMPLGGASVSIDSSEYDTKASELLLYVSGVDQNTYVNIVDSVKSVYWSAKVKKFNDLLCVAISVENLYFSDAAVFDPGTLDYANYAVTDVTVKQPSNISVSRIYIDANDAVYYQSENGIYRISGTDAAELVYEFSADIHDFTVHDGTMYAGTGAGLYSSDMTDLMNWTKETGYLSEGSTDGDTLDYDVRSIAFNPDGDMFLGCHTGGLIKRDASGNWSNLNIGLSYRNITPEKVNYVAAAFDSLDLHTTVSEWFGDYPDMDGDAKQYCLLVDLQDLYYLDAGDGVTFLDAVFDPNDQLSKSVSSSSNEMDLIYIDTDPLNLTSADTYAGIANALTTEIIQTQEAPEEEWVVKGLGELGEWIAGLKNATQTYTMGSNNNLLLIGDLSPEVNDYRYNFVFFDYLYSHYLNTEEKMKAYIALAETGMEGIEAALAELGGPTFKELYNDFSKAIHFDMLTLSNIDAKYIFPDINVTHGSRIFDWGFGSSNSPYITPQTAWSTIYYVTTGWDNAGYFWCPDFSGTVTFNGEDGTSYEFSTIKQSGTSFDYALVDLDDTQYGANSDMIDFGRADTNDHSRPYQLLYFIVNVHETPDPAGTAHVIHDEVIDTDEFSIGFNHNTGAPDYLNMFCYTSTRIYDDAGKAGLYDLDGDAVPDIEGPAGYLILDGDTTDISLAQFYINAAESDYVYSRTIDLSAIDTDISSVRIDLFGENLSSAGVAVSTSGTLAKINSAKRDITVSENATVTFPESAVTGQKQISVFLSKGDLVKQFRIESELDAPISDILFIGPEDLKIHKPVKIRMPLNSGKSAPEADIIPIVFRREKNRLVPLTQAEIMADGSVLFEAGQLGSYQVYLAKESVLSEETRIP
ncbi:hypothetical protein KKC74_10100, partial [bacterium]|nr:hypothetical protein [bacterium]